MELYSVFERDRAQAGISLIGPTRTLIHVVDGVLVEQCRIELHQLSSAVGNIKRKGFKLVMNEAFYDEAEHCFACKHPDFKDKSYFTFVFARADVNADVSLIEKIASPLLQSSERQQLLDWLRQLDLSSDAYVAPMGNPAFALVLCEFARLNSLDIYTAFPGIPSTIPSSDRAGWQKWLTESFNADDVSNTFDALNWKQPHSLNPTRTTPLPTAMSLGLAF